MSYFSLSDNGMLQIFSFFNLMIIWSTLKLFPYIYGYLFIFANTEIYVKYRVSQLTWAFSDEFDIVFVMN